MLFSVQRISLISRSSASSAARRRAVGFPCLTFRQCDRSDLKSARYAECEVSNDATTSTELPKKPKHCCLGVYDECRRGLGKTAAVSAKAENNRPEGEMPECECSSGWGKSQENRVALGAARLINNAGFP